MPVPFTSVVAWARLWGLDRRTAMLIVEIIHAVDAEVLRRDQSRRDLEAMRRV